MCVGGSIGISCDVPARTPLGCSWAARSQTRRAASGAGRAPGAAGRGGLRAAAAIGRGSPERAAAAALPPGPPGAQGPAPPPLTPAASPLILALLPPASHHGRSRRGNSGLRFLLLRLGHRRSLPAPAEESPGLPGGGGGGGSRRARGFRGQSRPHLVPVPLAPRRARPRRRPAPRQQQQR